MVLAARAWALLAVVCGGQAGSAQKRAGCSAEEEGGWWSKSWGGGWRPQWGGSDQGEGLGGWFEYFAAPMNHLRLKVRCFHVVSPLL